MTTSTRQRTRIGTIALAVAVVALFPVSTAGATTSTVAQDAEESDWWWLLVPFILILVGLALIWMFRRSRGAATAPPPTDESVESDVVREMEPPVGDPTPAVESAPDAADVPATDPTTAPVTGLVTSGAGPSAAATAGAQAAAAAMAARQAETSAPPTSGDAAAAAEVPQVSEPSVAAEIPPIPDFPDVMSGPDLSEDAEHHGSGDGVGRYRRNGESIPVPIGAHLPLVGSTEAPEGYPIKADADSGVYHTPDQPTYDEISPEIWFASESAAESAHFHKAGSD